MEALINKKTKIDWEQITMEENHGSGFTEWYIEGYDNENNLYGAIGSYTNDELVDVLDIEKL